MLRLTSGLKLASQSFSTLYERKIISLPLKHGRKSQVLQIEVAEFSLNLTFGIILASAPNMG